MGLCGRSHTPWIPACAGMTQGTLPLGENLGLENAVTARRPFAERDLEMPLLQLLHDEPMPREALDDPRAGFKGRKMPELFLECLGGSHQPARVFETIPSRRGAARRPPPGPRRPPKALHGASQQGNQGFKRGLGLIEAAALIMSRGESLHGHGLERGNAENSSRVKGIVEEIMSLIDQAADQAEFTPAQGQFQGMKGVGMFGQAGFGPFEEVGGGFQLISEEFDLAEMAQAEVFTTDMVEPLTEA